MCIQVISNALKGQQRIAQGNTLGGIGNTNYLFFGSKMSINEP